MTQELIQKYKELKQFEENCDFYFSRILNQSPKKPEYIILDLTHRCNLKCVMCDIYQDVESFKHDLNTEEIKKVIRQAKDWGVNEVIFSGGEALIRKDAFELIDYIKQIDFKCGIITNGVLSNIHFEKLKPHLISGNVSLTISLDGFNQKTHDAIRGIKGTYKQTTSLLSKLKELKKKHPINYTSISVIMNKNLEEFPHLIKYLKSMKVNEIQIQALLENNLVMKERHNKHMMWIPNSRLPVLDNTIDWLKQFKEKNAKLIMNTTADIELIKKYFRKQLKKEDVKCFQNYKTMLMSSDGRITTCYNSTGDIKKQYLQEIWSCDDSMHGRQLVKNCSNVCLTPCFVDFRLRSLRSIWQNFIDNIHIYSKEKQKMLIKEAFNIISSYQTQLQ